MGEIWILNGPTASGKSALALELAKYQPLRRPCVVVCADSVQAYQGLPLLTAQPSPEDHQSVPHLLYEEHSPLASKCSAASWAQRLKETVASSLQEGQHPLIVGGTGFYIKALLEGLAAIPDVDASVMRALTLLTTTQLFEALKIEDPVMAGCLNPGDRQRVMRALAVVRATGKSLHLWHKRPCPQTPAEAPWRARIFCVNPPAELLKERIKKRLDVMLKQGVVDEVKTFAKTYLTQVPALERLSKVQHPQHLTSKGVRGLLEQYGFQVKAWPAVTAALGFAELLLADQGALSLSDATDLMLRRTLQYAKRQRTWFRHQLPPLGRTPYAEILQMQTYTSAQEALEQIAANFNVS